MIRALFVILVATLSFSTPANAQEAEAKKVLLAPRAENTLQYLFTHLKIEFAFCAYGKEETRAFVIERVELAYIYRADVHNVDYEPCRGRGLLGDGHSHMDANNCQLSGLDRGNAITGRDKYTLLVCTDERYKLFSKREIEKLFTKEELKDMREAVRFIPSKDPPR
ncbi:hypothetical protein KW784_01715 [Candidatus Parcubacteria bacterium]|nr:hypothetical protein [Candidatus Parcubacteria bacterium]